MTQENQTANEQGSNVAPPVVKVLNTGGVICYPTEAVYGFGCDPDNQAAVEKLLAIKQRPVEKGLILIADNYAQCLPYIDDAKIPMDKRAEILSSWPGPITWILPVKSSTPKWLTGEHDTLAVRITAHPVVKSLCQQYGKPLVSTSANLSGQDPVMSLEEAQSTFADQVDFYVEGALGGANSPSKIKHAMTGAVIRD